MKAIERGGNARWAVMIGVIGIGLAGWGGVSAVGAGAAESTGERAPGLVALEEGRWDEARQVFGAQAVSARGAADTNREAEARFFLGFVDQSAAQATVDRAGRSALLQSALTNYEVALAMRPGTAGILNNLAQVQVELGRTNEALATLAKTLDKPDGRRGFYAQNYADLLLSAGRWRDACRFYAVVAEEQPQNRSIHGQLTDLCVAKGPDLLGWYLWELAQRGQVAQVQREALRVVDGPGLTPVQREELMGLVAFCLAKRQENARELLTPPLARRLNQLGTNTVVGGGAQGLLKLLAAEQPDPRGYGWWSQRYEPGADARRGIWPFEAFLQLVRALAEQAGVDGDPARQEAYLMLAVESLPEAPDPEALLQLANLYAEQRALPKLDALMRRYEVNIFEGKAQAYSAAKTERIYRYHAALGLIYSQLGRWTSPRGIDSAEFQLNLAMRTADRLNDSPETVRRVVVPPRLVELLADGYAKAGRADRAEEVRATRFERYLKDNRPEEASIVRRSMKIDPSLRLPPERQTGPGGGGAPKSPPGGRSATGAGRAGIEVGTVVQPVAGERSAQRLTVTEQDRLAAELQSVLAPSTSAAAKGRSGASRYVTLTNLPAGSELQEITVNGQQGTAVLRRGTNLVRVPFVNHATNAVKASGASVRYIRP